MMEPRLFRLHGEVTLLSLQIKQNHKLYPTATALLRPVPIRALTTRKNTTTPRWYAHLRKATTIKQCSYSCRKSKANLTLLLRYSPTPMLSASAKMLLNPSTRTTATGRRPPVHSHRKRVPANGVSSKRLPEQPRALTNNTTPFWRTDECHVLVHQQRRFDTTASHKARELFGAPALSCLQPHWYRGACSRGQTEGPPTFRLRSYMLSNISPDGSVIFILVTNQVISAS